MMRHRAHHMRREWILSGLLADDAVRDLTAEGSLLCAAG